MTLRDNDKFSQSIFDFIKVAKVQELESCVKRGTSINEVQKSKDKFTPLHYATYYGSLECLHWLLWQGADTSMTTPNGWTPAHVAAIRGQYSCIQALIKNNVSLNVRDHRGQTPAHLAATHGHSHTLQAILRSGADINLQDSNGWTPVHLAAYHGRLGCLQFLKTAGGKLDECDNDGNTPAHLAAMEGNLHCLKYILANSGNLNFLLSARNDQGDTPKTLAQQFYKDEVVEYLEAVEWDRDHPEQAENLAFPAHVAAFNGDLDHIKLLVEQGVININERDDKGSTMAHKAAGQGHLYVLKWLIENGADLQITNQAGETARDVAKRFAQLACVQLLKTDADDEENGSGYARGDMNGHSEIKDQILLSAQQKKDAKARARARVEELDKQLLIARSNFLQLGGRLEDTMNEELKVEQATIKTISELQNELEFERLKREKLETQLDRCRQELEKNIKSLRDYETKVIVLERYIQHTATDAKLAKKKQQPSVAFGSKTPISRSKSLNKRQHHNEVKSGSFIIKRGSSSSSKGYNHDKDEKDRPSSAHRTSSRPSSSSKSNLSNLTNAQLKELKQTFDDIDTDGSGSLSRKELRRAFRNLDIRCSDDEIEIVLNQMDSNHDGKISFEEFARVMARNYYKRHTKSEIKEAFRKFDINNSGKIAEDELQVVLSKMHRFYSMDEVHEMIRKVDRDRDGMISIDEFADMMEFDKE